MVLGVVFGRDQLASFPLAEAARHAGAECSSSLAEELLFYAIGNNDKFCSLDRANNRMNMRVSVGVGCLPRRLCLLAFSFSFKHMNRTLSSALTISQSHNRIFEMRNLLVVFLTPIGIHSYPISTEPTRFHRSIVTETRRGAALRINRGQVDDLLLPDGDEPPSKININPTYLSLATLETIYWYYLAPGIDPASRWFAPTDGELISKLLDPSIIFNQPGYAFSSLLLNCFLILPMVWAVLLLQEDEDNQVISPLPFCLAGFFVGGGALIPYMIFRQTSSKVDLEQNRYGGFLKLFEPDSLGPKLLCFLLFLVGSTFVYEVSNNSLQGEWEAFVDRLHHSQFISLALLDFTLLSCTVAEPIADDAKRRGYTYTSNQDDGDLRMFLLPLVGPVAWILKRPPLP